MTVLRDGETETGIRKWSRGGVGGIDVTLKGRKSEAVLALRLDVATY